MKSIKVFYNGKRLRDIYPYATKWQVFKWKAKKLIRKILFWTGVSIAIVAIYQLGGLLNPALQYKTVEAIKEVETPSPIMERIAGCESQGSAKLKGTHWDKNGQVLMRSNTNKSVDVGKYQINSVWFGKATELGLDITEESDNEQMAMWIYKNRGTGDWYASKSCWNK